MGAVRTKPFRSGNSEAIRLPRELAFGDIELTIVRSGDVMTIFPAERSVADMVKRLRKLPKPSSVEERDTEEIPERSGL